jgi:hypothetical protein
MSKANLVVTMVVVLAVAGMGFWMLKLEAKQNKLNPMSGDSPSSDVPAGDAEDRIRALEEGYDRLGTEVSSQRTKLSEVETRVEKLREDQKDLSLRLASLPRGDGGPAEPVVSPPDGDLRSAIEAVLAAKEEEQQRERREMMARRYAGFLLYGVEIGGDQREQVVKVINTFIGESEEVREQYSGDDADRQARDAAMANLEQRRNDELVRIVGATAFAQMEERLNRAGRFNRGPRRGDRGRQPRGR